MTQGILTDIDRFSTHDGPGIRTVIFFQGCPLRCAWCHSPETQPPLPVPVYRSARCIGCLSCTHVCPPHAVQPSAALQDSETPPIHIDPGLCTRCLRCTQTCPSGALAPSGRWRNLEEIQSILSQDEPFYRNSGGGVTLSGGEILMQTDFAEAILLECRSRGIHTAIETCGYGSASDLLRLAALSDLIYYDVKLLDPEKHRRYTGADNRLILQNLERLARSRRDIVIRIPCIPGINDSPEEIRSTAAWVKSIGLSLLELLPYNGAAPAKYEWVFRDYSLPNAKEQDKSHYEALRKIVRGQGLDAPHLS